jgi:hypothetical protein
MSYLYESRIQEKRELEELDQKKKRYPAFFIKVNVVLKGINLYPSRHRAFYLKASGSSSCSIEELETKDYELSFRTYQQLNGDIMNLDKKEIRQQGYKLYRLNDSIAREKKKMPPSLFMPLIPIRQSDQLLFGSSRQRSLEDYTVKATAITLTDPYPSKRTKDLFGAERLPSHTNVGTNINIVLSKLLTEAKPINFKGKQCYLIRYSRDAIRPYGYQIRHSQQMPEDLRDIWRIFKREEAKLLDTANRVRRTADDVSEIQTAKISKKIASYDPILVDTQWMQQLISVMENELLTATIAEPKPIKVDDADGSDEVETKPVSAKSSVVTKLDDYEKLFQETVTNLGKVKASLNASLDVNKHRYITWYVQLLERARNYHLYNSSQTKFQTYWNKLTDWYKVIMFNTIRLQMVLYYQSIIALIDNVVKMELKQGVKELLSYSVARLNEPFVHLFDDTTFDAEIAETNQFNQELLQVANLTKFISTPQMIREVDLITMKDKLVSQIASKMELCKEAFKSPEELNAEKPEFQAEYAFMATLCNNLSSDFEKLEAFVKSIMYHAIDLATVPPARQMVRIYKLLLEISKCQLLNLLNATPAMELPCKENKERLQTVLPKIGSVFDLLDNKVFRKPFSFFSMTSIPRVSVATKETAKFYEEIVDYQFRDLVLEFGPYIMDVMYLEMELEKQNLQKEVDKLKSTFEKQFVKLDDVRKKEQADFQNLDQITKLAYERFAETPKVKTPKRGKGAVDPKAGAPKAGAPKAAGAPTAGGPKAGAPTAGGSPMPRKHDPKKPGVTFGEYAEKKKKELD